MAHVCKYHENQQANFIQGQCGHQFCALCTTTLAGISTYVDQILGEFRCPCCCAISGAGANKNNSVKSGSYFKIRVDGLTPNTDYSAQFCQYNTNEVKQPKYKKTVARNENRKYTYSQEFNSNNNNDVGSLEYSIKGGELKRSTNEGMAKWFVKLKNVAPDKSKKIMFRVTGDGFVFGTCFDIQSKGTPGQQTSGIQLDAQNMSPFLCEGTPIIAEGSPLPLDSPAAVPVNYQPAAVNTTTFVRIYENEFDFYVANFAQLNKDVRSKLSTLTAQLNIEHDTNCGLKFSYPMGIRKLGIVDDSDLNNFWNRCNGGADLTILVEILDAPTAARTTNQMQAQVQAINQPQFQFPPQYSQTQHQYSQNQLQYTQPRHTQPQPQYVQQHVQYSQSQLQYPPPHPQNQLQNQPQHEIQFQVQYEFVEQGPGLAQAGQGLKFKPHTIKPAAKPQEKSSAQPQAKRPKAKSLADEELSNQMEKLRLDDLPSISVQRSRVSDTLSWAVVTPFGKVLEFGIYDKEYKMSVPHLTIAKDSEIRLHLHTIMECHIQLRLDSVHYCTVTMQNDEEEIIILDGYPSVLDFIIKVSTTGEYACKLPLSWIERDPQKSGLLVGFSYELFPEDQKLKGTENDAYRMATILRHSYGFGNLITLTGRDATFNKLSDTLLELSDVLIEGKSKTCVCYFSGHGARWKNDEVVLASDIKFKIMKTSIDKDKDKAKNEHAKDEKAKDEQAKHEQEKSEQTKDEQTKPEQAKPEQAMTEQEKTEQAKDDQAKDKRSIAEQVKTEQTKDEQAQARGEQAKNEQANDEQTKDEQAKDELAEDEDQGWKGESPPIRGGFWTPFLEKTSGKLAVTFIFDTCFSGKVYRGASTPKFLDGKYCFEDPVDQNPDWYPVSATSDFASLAASAREQPAMEILREDGAYGSALLAATEAVLEKSPADISYKEFHSCLSSKISEYRTEQTPLLEGAVDLGLFSDKLVTNLGQSAPMTVTKVEGPNAIELTAGNTNQLVFAGIYHIVNASSQLSAIVKVAVTTLHKATAMLTQYHKDTSLENDKRDAAGNVSDATVAVGDVAVFVGNGNKVDVVHGSDTPSAVHMDLAASSELFRLVRKSTFENISVSLKNDNWISTWRGRPFVSPFKVGEEEMLNGVERIAEAVKHISILDMSKSSPSLGLKVELLKQTPNGQMLPAKPDKELGMACFNAHQANNKGEPITNTGDKFGFVILNPLINELPLYISVFLISADGNRVVLYPKNSGWSELLSPGEDIKCVKRGFPVMCGSNPIPYLGADHYWDVLAVYATTSRANYDNIMKNTPRKRGHGDLDDVVSMYNFMHTMRNNSGSNYSITQIPFYIFPSKQV